VGDPGLDLKCRLLSAAWAVVDVLTIGKLGTGARQLEYYERQVAAGAEDYYARRGETPGVWLGAGLRALGIDAGGSVDGEGFMALMRGVHPGLPMPPWHGRSQR
jgi:hypothetical protein